MKRSELSKSIKKEIFEILSEETADDINAKKDAQVELNKELEKTAELTKENVNESLNPEVVKALDRFIKAMAKRYGYAEQDAVYAIMAALKQRKSDKKYEIPGLEGTMNALDNISIREEDDDVEMDKKASKAAKKGGSISTVSNKLQQTVKEMKSIVKKWKDAEGAEKDKLTNRLKELSKIKKELEGLL